VLATQNIPLPSPWRRLGARVHFGLRALGIPQALALVGCTLAWLASRLSPRAGREARFARRLGRTLGRLRGPFAKVGQFALLRVDLVAPEVREALVALRDRVAPIPFSWVRGVIEAELGGSLASLFAAIDPTPLGAASVAQAHAARLPGGQPVVVKVQYPWLAQSLATDLWLLRLGLRAGGLRAAGPWLAEFTSGLSEELDFRHEARVAAEIAANLAGDPQVLVPRVIASHSARRVLTMERWPTLALGDAQALAARGIPRAQLLEVIARAYARQIFQDGLFHADPHAGNLFVIDEPEAAERPRVLFVDFGLSKRLAPELARELRLGMLALLARDLDAFVAGMQRMDMIAPGAEPRVRAAVASMFARLSGTAAGPLGLGSERILALKDEAKQLLYDTPGLALPSDLLLYAKTLSYLFALGRELAPEVDLMRLSAPYLLRFLAQRDATPTDRVSAT
jgi:predicted unusual protein kinase regulating ubiquinone biosynthesis (AarF/ABC1/UbiB family)